MSYDSVAVLKNFSHRKHITYPLLSDPDSKTIRSFGILNETVPRDSMAWRCTRKSDRDSPLPSAHLCRHIRRSSCGWLSKLLTHPVRGLDNYRQLFEALNGAKGAIKVFCEIAEP